MRPDLTLPPTTQARIAVVGAGIAGLAAAHTLQGLADVVLFEAGERPGGQIHTVDLQLPDARGVPTPLAVDTGFLVFEESLSPNLMALFAQLGVPLARTDMSFSAHDPGDEHGGPGLLAQGRRLLDPRRWWMQAELLRFQRLRLDDGDARTLAALLRGNRFSDTFRDHGLLPLLGPVWAGPPEALLQMPAAAVLATARHRSPLLATGRQRWHTVAGGARQAVQKMLTGMNDVRLGTPVRQVARDADGVRIVTDRQVERFDAVVLACGRAPALALLGDGAAAAERDLLGAMRHPTQRAVLHTDTTVLPRAPRHWTAWNLEHRAGPPGRLCAHLLLNRLQPLPVSQPLVLSLNPAPGIDDQQVLGAWDRELVVPDTAAWQARQRLPERQGTAHTWYAGAWCGDGSLEDGLKAGLHAARALIDRFALAPRLDAAAARRAALPGVLG